MDPHMGRAAPRLKDEGTALFAYKRGVGCSEETGADLNPFLGVARAARGGRLVHERAAVYVQDVPSNERGLRRAQEPRALGHFLRRPETVQGHFLSDNRP